MIRLIATACALTSLVLVGCAGPKTIARDTPKATIQAFVDAMKSGDYDAIAAGWDYEIAARADNSDWDSIPKGQRKLIVDKLQENKASEVSSLGGMMTGEATVGEATNQGQRALVPVTVGQATTRILLVQVDDVWKVLRMAERSATQ